jgi:hypothetical protein
MHINLCLTKHLVCEYFNIIYMYITYEVYPWILGHIIVLGWIKREHMQTITSYLIHIPHFAAHSKCQKRWCEFVLVMVLDMQIILHYCTCCFVFFALITLNKVGILYPWSHLSWNGLRVFWKKIQRVYVLFIWYFPFDVYNVLFPIPIELSAFPYFKMWYTCKRIILIFISPSPLYSKLTQVSP